MPRTYRDPQQWDEFHHAPGDNDPLDATWPKKAGDCMHLLWFCCGSFFFPFLDCNSLLLCQFLLFLLQLL